MGFCPFPLAAINVQARTRRIRPRQGALVVSINSEPVTHLKVSDVAKILDDIVAKNRRESAAARMEAARLGRGRAGSGGSSGGRRQKIRLLMREVEAHAWLPNWRYEVRAVLCGSRLTDTLECIIAR